MACSACRRVQLVETRFRQSACRGCRKAIPLQTAKFYYRGDDAEAARAVLMRVSAQLQGMGIEDYGQLLARLEEETPGDVEEALGSLATRGDFTREEFGEELRRKRVPGSAERLMARLSAENRIYEPKPGRFRVS